MTASSLQANTVILRGHEIPTGLFINGEWLDTLDTFDVVNPSTGDVIAKMSDGKAIHASLALDAADSAQKEWGKVAPRVRANLFHKTHALLVEKSEIFAEIMTSESGKPLHEARAEFNLSADFFLWFAEQIAHLHGTYASGSNGGYRVVTTHHPVGPCFLVTPWNFPFLMIARKAGAALAAGCTVITKSAKETPLTSAIFVKILEDAGFPKGVINLIHTTSSSPISSTLMSDSRLRKVSFTGSTGVGSTLLKLAAPNIINSSMELGGDAPFIVLKDADIDLAVQQAVICKFRNAGQACVAANRIIVHVDVEEEFTRKFVELTKKLVVGDGFEKVDVGPIISHSQRENVKNLVEQLKGIGGELLTGGEAIEGPGFFFEPTVFRIIDRGYNLCNEELFAPIATIYPIASVQEAIDFANHTNYGLTAYVFSENLSTAVAVSESLEFGMVGVNRGIMADPAAPFGGVKSSGTGREGGHDGIYEFLEPQYLAITINDKKVLN
jgi:succinate-semialdehyde dehydrogenase/glutarate-semialdehyde dehydrogenase